MHQNVHHSPHSIYSDMWAVIFKHYIYAADALYIYIYISVQHHTVLLNETSFSKFEQELNKKKSLPTTRGTA